MAYLRKRSKKDLIKLYSSGEIDRKRLFCLTDSVSLYNVRNNIDELYSSNKTSMVLPLPFGFKNSLVFDECQGIFHIGDDVSQIDISNSTFMVLDNLPNSKVPEKFFNKLSEFYGLKSESDIENDHILPDRSKPWEVRSSFIKSFSSKDNKFEVGIENYVDNNMGESYLNNNSKETGVYLCFEDSKTCDKIQSGLDNITKAAFKSGGKRNFLEHRSMLNYLNNSFSKMSDKELFLKHGDYLLLDYCLNNL